MALAEASLDCSLSDPAGPLAYCRQRNPVAFNPTHTHQTARNESVDAHGVRLTIAAPARRTASRSSAIGSSGAPEPSRSGADRRLRKGVRNHFVRERRCQRRLRPDTLDGRQHSKGPFDKIPRDRVAIQADEPRSKNPICAGLVQSAYVVECQAIRNPHAVTHCIAVTCWRSQVTQGFRDGHVGGFDNR